MSLHSCLALGLAGERMVGSIQGCGGWRNSSYGKLDPHFAESRSWREAGNRCSYADFSQLNISFFL